MTPRSSGRARFVAGLALAALIPLVGHLLRAPRGPSCATDGVTLDGAPVVRLVGQAGDSRSYCCVRCAEAWVLRAEEDPPTRVLVTDETTREELDAREAWFVRSLVIAQPATQDRVHAFASQADAVRHAKAYRGTVLSGRAKPFFDTH